MKIIKLLTLVFPTLISLISYSQLEINPKDTMTNRLRLKALNQEVELGKGTYYTFYNRGLIVAALGDTALALDDYDLSISMNSEFASALINRGTLYQKLHEWEKAEDDFNAAVKIEPKSAVAVNNRGYLYLEMGFQDKALKDFDQSISLDKNLTQSYMNKVAIYTRRNEMELAIDVCTMLINVRPEEAISYTTRADVYNNFGRLHLALKDLDYAVELSGNDPKYLIERSRFKDDIGDDLGSIDDCDMAISKAPNVAYYHLMRSRPLYDMQEFGMVIESCDRALQLNPNEFKAMVMKGNVLDAFGRSKEAEELYERAILVEPNNDDAYIQMSVMYYAKKNIPKALKNLERFTNRNGINTRILKMNGQLYAEMGDFEKALIHLDQLVKLSPVDADAQYLRGLVNDTLNNMNLACRQMLKADSLGSQEAHHFLRMKCRSSMNAKLMKMEDLEEEAYFLELAGNFEEAIIKYNDAIAIVPDSARLYYNRGKAKRKLNDHLGAIEDYSKGLQVGPSEHVVNFWVSIGVSYSFLENINEARKAYQEAIKVDPTYAMSYYNLALFDAQKGNFKEAIKLIKESLLYDPNYVLALIALGDCYLELEENSHACEAFKRAEKLGETSVFGKRIRACKGLE